MVVVGRGHWCGGYLHMVVVGRGHWCGGYLHMVVVGRGESLVWRVLTHGGGG